MKLETKREVLLKPLQHVIGVVERRQALPILSNVLVIAQPGELTLTATDMEVKLSAKIELPVEETGEVTLPARKLLDILRALPEDANVSFCLEKQHALIRCGRSRFSLATLPAADFPAAEELPFEGRIQLSQQALRTLLERTHFAVAQQDVRYYLNGLLLHLQDRQLRAVATDGHRLALCDIDAEIDSAEVAKQVIVPRKGVQELLRLLASSETAVVVQVGANHIEVRVDDITFTSKLIEGKFPDYQRVIPEQSEHPIVADRLALRAALTRTAILSSEKYRGVRLRVEQQVMYVQANNPEQEEAEEELQVDYSGPPLEVGFNVIYLLDALGAISGDSVKIFLTDANNSCLIQELAGEACKYIIMPMRL